MNPKHRIALLTRDDSLYDLLELNLDREGCQIVRLPGPSQALGFVYADPPDIVIIDLTSPEPAFHRVLTDLKQDSYFSVIPVLGIINADAVATTAWDEFPLDDFIPRPVDFRELHGRIRLSLQRIQRIFDNNPLTKLPGNTSIQRAIEGALGRPMAVCYIDINHFKPYNDSFGFSRGDEVLRMVARIMSNTVREAKGGGFVGHIGGDDFVFIVPIEAAETVCAAVIDRFNVIASDLFGEAEKTRGFYVAKDRRGVAQQIPLLGISIAVVPTDNPLVNHAGKVAEVAAELKHVAKKSNTSCYVVDRRRTARGGAPGRTE